MDTPKNKRRVGPIERKMERSIRIELTQSWEIERRSHLHDYYDDDFQARRDGCYD